jgi:hypothetical protein
VQIGISDSIHKRGEIIMADAVSSAGLVASAGNLDTQWSTAESLMASSSMQDQLKGQMLMAQVTQQFQAISTAIQNKSKAAEAAIQNSRS